MYGGRGYVTCELFVQGGGGGAGVLCRVACLKDTLCVRYLVYSLFTQILC